MTAVARGARRVQAEGLMVGGVDMSAAWFEPHVGTPFRVDLAEADDVALVLVSVARAPEQPGAPRSEPFVLTFLGADGCSLGQGTYVMEHDVLGRVEMFMVPHQPLADGLPRLDAVFN